MSGLLWAPPSLTTSQVLIICWGIHVYNHREIFYLVMLIMGRPIPLLLLLRFHHYQSLHLQILLKREIYLKREIKLILSGNTSGNNGLNQFWNKTIMGK